MTDRTIQFYRAASVLIALLLLGGVAAGGLAVVNFHQQSGRRAKAMGDLERQLADATRQLNSLEAAVAEAHQPDALRARLGDRLGPAQTRQVVWVRPLAVPGARPATPDLSLQIAALAPAPAPARPR